MDFYDVLDQVLGLLQRRGRVTYRALKRQFDLDDAFIEDLKEEILYSQTSVVDEAGRGLVWTGDLESASSAAAAPTAGPSRPPLSYTPQHLAERILTSRAALEGERKQVTVLFADIKGSTELIEGLDPEDARQLLDPAIHLMMEAIHRYEGTVNQVLGDGIMALFGAPLAHEDDAMRACYAALAMQAAMQSYAEEVRRSYGIAMRIRVGLNSGEVVVRAIGNDLHMDYSAVGQTTHLAARMEQLATPGSIMLSAATLRFVEGLVQVNDLGPIPVKGLTEPVEVYELVGVTAFRRRLQATVGGGLTRFVGRQYEIETLHQALSWAATGHGQVVAVVGEAGVGKSRLVYEFTHSRHLQGWLVLESASVSYGKATPYFPVIDLLKRYVHIDHNDDTRTIRAKVTGHILTLDETLQDTTPALLSLLDALPEASPFLSLDPPQRRQRTLDALKRVLFRESQVQPLLLVFEDLHWIDSETQALLDSLVDSLPTAQLMLLVNYRPEYQHGWGNKTYYTQMRLDPLPPASAEELLQALLGDDPSLEPLKKLLIERTEGNPFFLEESVRTLVETQVLVGEQGVYRLAQTLPTLQIPATVQAVLTARIDRLPPEEKRLLQTAAVIGMQVSLPLLQTIAELPDDTLHRGLAHLHTAEFLYETRLFPEREYTFRHALTQNVAYQSLLTGARQQIHQQIAQALATRFPETVETQPELLARHYTEAGLHDQAVVYWQQAGEKAIQRSAHVEAISHLTTGLTLLASLPDTPERTEQELALQITLGPVLMATKGQAALEVEQAYARARELCQQLGDSSHLFPVLWGLWRFYRGRAELQTARELGEQLLHSAEGTDDQDHLLQAHHALWTSLFSLGEFVAARTHLEQGIALYEPQRHRAHAVLYGGHDPGECGLSYAAQVLWCLGYPDQALQQSRAALALAQEHAHPYSLAHTLNSASQFQQFLRNIPTVLDHVEAQITLATEQGFTQYIAQGTILRGWSLVQKGQTQEGIAQMRQGLAAYQATGAEAGYPYLLALLAEVYGNMGQTEEGLQLLSEALTLVGKHQERWWEAELHRLRGALLLQQAGSAMEQAEACLYQALDIARRQHAKSLELRAAASLGRLWQKQNKRAEAHQLLAEIYDWFTEGFDTVDLQEAKALLHALGSQPLS